MAKEVRTYRLYTTTIGQIEDIREMLRKKSINLKPGQVIEMAIGKTIKELREEK